MLTLDYIFPTPIWSTELDIDIPEMQNICYEIAKTRPSRSRSGRGSKSYQSAPFAGEQIIKDGGESDEFAKALTQIKTFANEAFDTFECFATTVGFANTWININNNGAYNEIHTHPRSAISGVLYIKVPREGDPGALSFYRNPMESFTIQSFSGGTVQAKAPHTLPYKSYRPREKRLILFPAWVSHGVTENSTDEDRISISFNLVAMRDMAAVIKARDEESQNKTQIYERAK
jgi:uncharacterized protein (TIGR02466 family)